MEYEKYIKRLVLGYLKKECKYAYKVFLKYNFHSQHKHIPTRVAGQTLEDILRVYSRIEEIVQGHLEDTNYYKERSIEFSSPSYLDDQLLYLLDKGRPFTPASTSCPRSPTESSVVETQDEVFTTNLRSDVDTTPEHTLPGNISTHDDNYTLHFRSEPERSAFSSPCMDKFSTSEKEIDPEVMTLKVPEKAEHKKLANTNTTLNTPEVPSFSQRDIHDKNKESVGTELDDMLDFLGTRIGKSTSVESTTSACSSNITHTTTPTRNWQHIDEHNNRAISSILSAVNISDTKVTNFPSATNDNVAKNDDLNSFQGSSISTASQIEPAAANFTSNQCLIPNTGGMYIVPQSTTSAIQTNQQQQFYIVNQPMVIPQPPVMQFIQPVPSTCKPIVIQSNQKTTSIKDSTHLSEQDIMAMPTIILNERNEITYADSGSFPANPSFKLNEAHNIKEYINLYSATDESPILKVHPQKKGAKGRLPIKPTPTIKVEIYQRDTPLPIPVTTVETNVTTSYNIPNDVCMQTSSSDRECTRLPNLIDIIENQPSNNTDEEPTKRADMDLTSETINDPKIDSFDKAKHKIISSVCTPSPLKTTVRKPTPKSGSHVRNLTFPSPIRKTSEKLDSKRSSPRIINKQQAAKDLFKDDNEEERKSTANEERTEKSNKTTKSPVKVINKNVKQSRQKFSKTPKKFSERDKIKTPNKRKKQANKPESITTVKDMEPRHCWDSNLRKMIPPTIEKDISTPRRTSNRNKSRQSTEQETCDPDGKKLEEALKTPQKSEKSKRKTPNRKKIAKVNKKSKEKTQSPDIEIETKGETKILSPSKLNANKRNILSNDIDDVTPSNVKESSQYPISSKTRRNINSLLETPLKEYPIPPTPGTIPDKSDTPFTPMLRANLKDFTGGDTFSIDTPNFPITPGLAAMVNTSSAYYILNDNESNKVTEATVLSEEKKSSVRKSDDDEVELSPRVYGSKEILENFNKSRVGKKNLELLDNRGVKWDGSSDREEKSDDNSENSEDESNSTVIQNKNLEQSKKLDVSSKKSKTIGKCMATLESELLKDKQDSSIHSMDIGDQADLQRDKVDKGGGQSTDGELKVRTSSKISSNDSDSEVLNKISYDEKKNSSIALKLPVSSTSVGSEMSCNLQDSLRKNKEKDELERERSKKNISEDKDFITTEEVIRRTISDVSVKSTLGVKSTSTNLKEQLEEKKKRFIELDKTATVLGTRKTPKRTVLKPQSHLNLSRNKRKSQSPKKVLHSVETNEEEDVKESGNEKNKKSDLNVEENVRNKTGSERENQSIVLGTETVTECHTVDSQDEFFKKSGTNLHRKNKEIVLAAEKGIEPSKEILNDKGKDKTTIQDSLMTSKIYPKTNKSKNPSKNNMEDDQNNGKSSKDLTTFVQKEDKNVSATESNISDEFEKSWDTCNFHEFESEHVVISHDESEISDKKLEDYDFGILTKKFELGVPCSDGSTVGIILTVSPFKTLLDLNLTDECETTDGSRDEADSSFECSSKPKNDVVSDSEKNEDTDEFKGARKRKHRSDSCNSNSSAKKMKKNYGFLNENNINKLLTKLHGPS